MLEQKRGKLDDLKFDPTKNVDYDEAFAKIGREETEETEDPASEEQDENEGDEE